MERRNWGESHDKSKWSNYVYKKNIDEKIGKSIQMLPTFTVLFEQKVVDR